MFLQCVQHWTWLHILLMEHQIEHSSISIHLLTNTAFCRQICLQIILWSAALFIHGGVAQHLCLLNAHCRITWSNASDFCWSFICAHWIKKKKSLDIAVFIHLVQVSGIQIKQIKQYWIFLHIWKKLFVLNYSWVQILEILVSSRTICSHYSILIWNPNIRISEMFCFSFNNPRSHQRVVHCNRKGLVLREGHVKTDMNIWTNKKSWDLN